MHLFRTTLLAAALCGPLALTAQQVIPFTQFWNAQLQTNPATAGFHYKHAAHAIYRNQWDGVNGAPNSLAVNYAARIDRIHGAAGISYRYDVIGFNDQHDVLAHYAFHLPIGEQNILSFGVSGGISGLRMRPEWEAPQTVNDPLLPAGSRATVFAMNAGIAFHAPKWNAGFSSTNVTAPTLHMSPVTGTDVSYTVARHYWLFADYTFDIYGNVRLRPQVQLITDAVKYSANASLMLLAKNAWGGVNFSYDNYIGLMAGYDIRGKYRIGYSYDYTINQLSNVSRGTHEIVLSYLIK